MIKKMLAMLVAISCAFGAWADTHINGTDFSGLTPGPFTVGLDDGGQTGTTYWYNGATNDFDGTIVVEGGKNFLTFESSITNPLYRTFKSCDGASSTSTLNPTNIGKGLFIDTTVQFTPYLVNESHDAPSKLSAEDKLIVWVCETESTNNVSNTTNLIVTAGYLGASGLTSVSNYVVTTIGTNTLDSATVSGLCSHTNRLTIKAYETITTEDATVAGFVVYLNEMPLGYAGDAIATGSPFYDKLKPTPGYWYGNRQLFPSLMSYNASGNPGQLSGVGYAGMGKIGDVFLDDSSTDHPKFADDGHYFTVVLGAGVTSFVYNNVVYSNNYASSVELAVDSVTISNVTYDADHGWKHKDDTWRNENDTVVNNRVGAAGDYGTFYFADGGIFTLIGYQANYIVNGTEYDNLTDALEAALTGGYPLVLNNDVEITEGDGSLAIGVGDTLVLDLQGHTIKGTGDEYTPTIINDGGTLTIIDTSTYHDGKVLNNDNSSLCLASYSGSTTTLNAGIYEEVDEFDGDLTTITINGGTYRDNVYGPSSFYMSSCIATGKQIVEWITDGGDNYAVIGEPSGDTWDITFSTNNVVVTEWNLTVDDGDPIGNHIPNFTGGSWDAPAPTADTVVTSDTNFNYTIAVQLSYFPQSTIEEQWADRDGTAAKPFVVRNLADLNGLKDDIRDGYNIDKCFEQVADIDMAGQAAWPGIGAGEVITTGAGAFEGTYDGGNHVISNVTFASARYTGLFKSAVGAVIKNLTVDVDGIQTTASQYGAGAFVGTARDSFFTNLVATGTIGTSAAPANHTTGGLFGRFEGCVAYACTNRVEIWCSKDKVGGIAAVGQSNAADTFELCSNEGNIHASWDGTGDGGVGGILGWQGYGYKSENQSASYINCRSIGLIDSSAVANKTGSFVGERRDGTLTLSGTNIAIDGMRVIGSHQDNVTYGKSIGGGLVELCTQAAFETNNTYSTMWSNLTPTFAFEAAGTISFNTNLFQATAFAITATGIDVTESESGGIVTFTAGASDPWAPASEDPADVAAKVDEIFGSESDVAAHVTTYAQYEALVTYIQSTTGAPATPDLLTEGQVDWMWKSYILGANPLFDEEPAVQITSLTAGATAGLWDFTVKVTEGDDTDAYNVAADKVGALVKISSSLTSGTWVAPTAGNIEANKLLGGNLIKVTVNFGDGTSGFMKVSEE